MLVSHQLGHLRQHAGLIDHVRAQFRDALLVGPGREHGRPAWDGVAQGQLPDVVHERRVLQFQQLRLVHPQIAADGHGKLADPGGHARPPRTRLPR